MTRGQPDFGPYAAKTDIAGLSDMADLAVRLGSIVEFDRRGDVVRIDDFEDGIAKYTTDKLGATAYARVNTDTALSGAQCIKLSTGAVLGDWISVIYYSAPFSLGKVGVKIAGSFHLNGGYFTILNQVFDGVYYRRGQVRIDLDNITLAIKNSAGGWTNFDTNADVERHLNLLHNIKLVVDHENNLYSRFMINAKEWDLSSYELYKVADATLPYHVSSFTLESDSALGTLAWLDNFVLTINEP